MLLLLPASSSADDACEMPISTLIDMNRRNSSSNNNNSNSTDTANSGSAMQYMTVRVQYLDDTDPFSSTNYPEPTRPPSYTFNLEVPLCEQISGVHRLLKAPHKVGELAPEGSSFRIGQISSF